MTHAITKEIDMTRVVGVLSATLLILSATTAFAAENPLLGT
jgi:hypothetical protein